MGRREDAVDVVYIIVSIQINSVCGDIAIDGDALQGCV